MRALVGLVVAHLVPPGDVEDVAPGADDVPVEPEQAVAQDLPRPAHLALSWALEAEELAQKCSANDAWKLRYLNRHRQLWGIR